MPLREPSSSRESNSSCVGTEGSQAIYKGVGNDLQEAITARDNQIANLDAEGAARAAGRTLVTDGTSRVVLAEVIGN